VRLCVAVCADVCAVCGFFRGGAGVYDCVLCVSLFGRKEVFACLGHLQLAAGLAGLGLRSGHELLHSHSHMHSPGASLPSY
jgi:hypothetical protein